MSKAKIITGAIAGALAIAAPLVAKWEGKSNDPYKDIVGVWTVCTGQTNVEMRRYTLAECDAMLQASLGEYAKSVLERNPTLKDHPYQLAAATSLSYNIGVGAYWRSTVAKRFAAGNFKGACDAMLLWNRAGGKVIRGLQRRREDERRLCLTGL